MRAGDPLQRLGMGTGRAREDRHVAGERLDARQAEGLPVRRADDGVGGVDPGRDLLRRDGAEGQQLGVVARELAGAVEALAAALGVVGKQEVASVGVKAEALAGRVAVGGAEAGHVDAAGQDRDVAGDPGSRDLGCEGRRRCADEVHPSEHGAGDRSRAAVVQVVSVQRHEPMTSIDGQGRPGRQPEVGVHDVEATGRRTSGADRARRARSCGCRPARTRAARRRPRRCAAATGPGRARSCRAPAGSERGTCW